MKKILPARLKIAREERGLTQEQAADRLNIAIGTLSGYERGYRGPSPEMLAKLADLYDVSTDWLLGRDPFVGRIPADSNYNKIVLIEKHVKRGLTLEEIDHILEVVGELTGKERRK